MNYVIGLFFWTAQVSATIFFAHYDHGVCHFVTHDRFEDTGNWHCLYIETSLHAQDIVHALNQQFIGMRSPYSAIYENRPSVDPANDFKVYNAKKRYLGTIRIVDDQQRPIKLANIILHPRARN